VGRIPPSVLEAGLKAARAIGNGLYGVDIKECEDGAYVIEVNDNPSLESGEDGCYPKIYHRIVEFLLEKGAPGIKDANN
jgi:glutathione synthase/RimK-type ligase-like ATP-grasp enzyme